MPHEFLFRYLQLGPLLFFFFSKMCVRWGYFFVGGSASRFIESIFTQLLPDEYTHLLLLMFFHLMRR